MAKKKQTVKQCKQAARAAFPHLIDLRIGYEAECERTKGERPYDECDYLENIIGGGDMSSIGYFGIDCDKQSGEGSAKVSEASAMESRNMIILFSLVGVGIILSLIIWYS